MSDTPIELAPVAPQGREIVARPAAVRTLVELTVVTLLACVWFFWGIGTGDLYGTEPLRALIVKEMLAHDAWLIPTVHERVYLRKPPLHAWVTAAVARVAGRCDEAVVRWPSAALGVAYVLMMYFAVRWLVDPRAGPVGAFFAAANWFVLDYGTRAELDEGVLLFAGLATLLIGRAWLASGGQRWGLAALAYAAALAGSFWKAPHVLVCVWLTLLALVWLEHRRGGDSAWRFVRHPAHLALAAASLAIVLVWYVLLGREAGGGRVASFTALEVVLRLLPFRPEHILAILNGPLEFFYVTLPFNLFAAVVFLRKARTDRESMDPRHWWFLLAWAGANIGLLLIVPAKAPRYWFTCFPPLVVLATYVWQRFVDGRLSPPAHTAATFLTWAWLALLATGGAALLVVAVLLGLHELDTTGVQPQAARLALLSGGVVILAAGAIAMFALRQRRYRVVAGMFVLALLALKPADVYALSPRTAAANSYRAVAVDIAGRVPAAEPIFVLSEKSRSDRSGEVSDLGWFTNRVIRWPRDVDELVTMSPTSDAYVLVRAKALQQIRERFGDSQVTALGEFDWADGPLHLLLVRVRP